MNIQDIFQTNILPWVLSGGLKIIAIIIGACLANKLSKNFVGKLIKSSEERLKTLVSVFTSFLGVVIWLIAILMILPEFGINIGPLLAGLGVAGLALGMGAKNVIQDYLNGLFILIEDQYRIGEEVEISGKKGKVKDLNLRRTILQDAEGKIHYIPSGQIKVVTNFSRTKN